MKPVANYQAASIPQVSACVWLCVGVHDCAHIQTYMCMCANAHIILLWAYCVCIGTVHMITEVSMCVFAHVR